LNITYPFRDVVWPIGSSHTINWTSSSVPNGTHLVALVQYSSDGGKTFRTLGHDINGTSIRVDSDRLPGSSSARVSVQISDGINTAIATSDPFIVEDKPLSVHIIAPKTNNSLLASLPFTLQGVAFDPQELLSDEQFVWSSNLDGVLGTGRNLIPSNLRGGEHTITLTVTDSRGLSGRDSVHLNVMAIPLNNTMINKWGSRGNGPGQFNIDHDQHPSPHGIAMDSLGNIYVTDLGGSRVEKFDRKGVFLKDWGSFGSADGQFSLPWAIAADSLGYVYVADSCCNHRIEKFTADGKFITKWGGFGTGDGQFNHPEAIAVDPGQFVYVVDFNKRIQKFDSNGKFITKWGSNGTGEDQLSSKLIRIL
jgi:hypothetical protein